MSLTRTIRNRRIIICYVFNSVLSFVLAVYSSLLLLMGEFIADYGYLNYESWDQVELIAFAFLVSAFVSLENKNDVVKFIPFFSVIGVKATLFYYESFIGVAVTLVTNTSFLVVFLAIFILSLTQIFSRHTKN